MLVVYIELDVVRGTSFCIHIIGAFLSKIQRDDYCIITQQIGVSKLILEVFHFRVWIV